MRLDDGLDGASVVPIALHGILSGRKHVVHIPTRGGSNARPRVHARALPSLASSEDRRVRIYGSLREHLLGDRLAPS